MDESTKAFARHGRDHAIKLLDAFLDPEAVNVHAVDVVWTFAAHSDNGKTS